MHTWVRVFGSIFGLVVAAFGLAVASGMVVGPIPCRTECQMNEALFRLLGSPAAGIVIGLFWIAGGVALIFVINSKSMRRLARNPKSRSRR